jgi:hypothetical protein
MGSDRGRVALPHSSDYHQLLCIPTTACRGWLCAARLCAIDVERGMSPSHDNTTVLPPRPYCQKPSLWTGLSPVHCLVALKTEDSADFRRLSLPPCLQPCTSFSPSALVENKQHQLSLSEGHITSNASSHPQCFSGLACGVSRHPFWRSSSSSRNA